MDKIPIPSIDTVDTCELGVSIDTSTKYRYLSILSLLCLRPACMYENLKKMPIKAKQKNAGVFLEVCLMELDQGKINCVPDKILHSRPKPFFCNDIVSQ